MRDFDELARLLAAPSIAAPRRRDREEHRHGREPPKDSYEPHNLEEFEYIEVGDPRDGP